MNQQPYPPGLDNTTFMLGRHGESIRNAGIMAQGRGDEITGLPVNGLTELGVEQIQAAPAALAAAGIAVVCVNSSQLPRARQSAEVFVDAHPEPKPVLAASPVFDIQEVSQHGWETIHTRDEVKTLRAAALAAEVALLQKSGLNPALKEYVAWTMRLGNSGSPLGSALAGIRALEKYGPQSNELIFGHAMLNRYMDAAATHLSPAERSFALSLLRYGTPLGKISVLQLIQEKGVPPFPIADDRRNRPSHGSVTEYTVNHTTGLWAAGRRITPPNPSDTQPYIEHQRGDDGMWNPVEPTVAS